MKNERITRSEIESYKREILDQVVTVTIADAAEALSVHPSTVSRYIRERRIASYNGAPGQRSKGVRLLASDLRDYVRSIKVDLQEIEG